MNDLLERLVQSVAWAYTRGTAESVVKALAWGEDAAGKGRPIALPILLDVIELLQNDHPPQIRSAASELFKDYDQWMQQFHKINPGNGTNDWSWSRSMLSKEEQDAFMSPLQSKAPDYLPYLTTVITIKENQYTSAEWQQAYRELRNSKDHRSNILAAWQGARNTDEELWNWWWSDQLDEPYIDFWNRFVTEYCQQCPLKWDLNKCLEKGLECWQQGADHHAGKVYLQAEITKLTEKQTARIQHLLRRKLDCMSNPLITSYEEQDPYNGAITLATLSMGEYGLFKIINRSAIWLADPPASLPPDPVRIHLCWTEAYRGLSHKTQLQIGASAPSNRQNVPPKAPVEYFMRETSVIQGIVALIIDDWRTALRELPVLFYLHDGVVRKETQKDEEEKAKTLALGKGGKRWRNPEDPALLPPSLVVHYLFQRQSFAKLAGGTGGTNGKTKWKVPANAADTMTDWWCGCISGEDLKDLGFQKVQSQFHEKPPWVGPPNHPNQPKFPQCLSHVIVLEFQQQCWTICQANQDKRQIELWPVMEGDLESDPYPFHQLRGCALDLALSALEIRM
ncbi:MAG TPA: hypothetical protein VHY08_12560 [Bacillota bacterium]|nr:hypothetical protein [Bacillota bacterium]